MSKKSHKRSCFRYYLLLLALLLPGLQLQAQETDSSMLQRKRLKPLLIGSATGYGALQTGLYSLWYAEQPQTSFHFFNDNSQWMGVDKVGHGYSSFQLSRLSAEALQWSGVPASKAWLYGSLSGFLLMAPIELMDGFAAGYGASWGDLAANGFGSLLYGMQQWWWQESRIKPKFSFHPSPYASQRPSLLGDSFAAQLLKDYNGQTYWLSVDVKKFLPERSRYPAWLNFAVGFGTEAMVYARPAQSREAGYHPQRQFYLSPDISLSHIKSNKKLVRVLLFVLDGIHLPAPALEINKNRIRFHPVYF
jgi:uncharacterized protein YfiM (DUF2279 family)